MRSVAVFQYLRGVLDAIIEQKDIDAVALRVGELLDESPVVDDGGTITDRKPNLSLCTLRIFSLGKARTIRTGSFWFVETIAGANSRHPRITRLGELT